MEYTVEGSSASSVDYVALVAAVSWEMAATLSPLISIGDSTKPFRAFLGLSYQVRLGRVQYIRCLDILPEDKSSSTER